MPRVARQAPGGLVYHVLNRAVARLPLFQKDGDFEAFERVLLTALEKHPTRLLAYCLLPNHWHMVLWPRRDGELTALVRYVERNALRAHLVARAEKWRWSSFWHRRQKESQIGAILNEWPVLEPGDWTRIVNQAQTEGELEAVRRALCSVAAHSDRRPGWAGLQPPGSGIHVATARAAQEEGG